MFDGMNKKTIIQLVVIVAAFGACGLVLYNGLFKGQSSPSAANMSTPIGFPGVTADINQDILPYGDNLDFSKALDSKRFQYNQIEYQKLNPQNEVGISPDSLITPLPAGVSGP
jgi:hypothetical protein